MTAKGPELSVDGRSVTVRHPLTFQRRGGRKQVVAPNGTESLLHHNPSRIDSSLVKVIARAHRWQRMLESGDYSSIQELAHSEKINASYLARVLRVTLLAPTIVEKILDGSRGPERITLDRVLKPFPLGWSEQQRTFALKPYDHPLPQGQQLYSCSDR